MLINSYLASSFFAFTITTLLQVGLDRCSTIKLTLHVKIEELERPLALQYKVKISVSSTNLITELLSDKLVVMHYLQFRLRGSDSSSHQTIIVFQGGQILQ